MMTSVALPAPQTRGNGPAGPGPSGPAGRRPQPRRAAAPGKCRLSDLARNVAQLYLEVEAGRRPAAQVARLLDQRLSYQLEGVWVRGPASPGRVVRVNGRLTHAECYEAVALVRRGERFGALALQLRRRDGRWAVTEASRPEDGPLPPPPYEFDEDEPDGLDAPGALTGAETPFPLP